MLSKIIRKNAGHPWDGQPGWDGLDVLADTAAELDAFIEAARKKHWDVWIRGTVGVKTKRTKPAAYLYKPHLAKAPWTDNPSRQMRNAA